VDAGADEWYVASGTWNVVNGAAQNTSSATTYPYSWLAVADDDHELRHTYSFDSVTSGEPGRAWLAVLGAGLLE
jgi:hypothetical protein